MSVCLLYLPLEIGVTLNLFWQSSSIMIPFPNIDPSIIELGPFKLRWYGLMYVLGFLAAYFLMGIQKGAHRLGLQGKLLQDLIFYMALGLVVGARLGYVLFYQFANLGY